MYLSPPLFSHPQVGSWESTTLNFDDSLTEITASATQCEGRCNECRKEADKNPESIYQPGQIQIPGLFAVHESGDHRVECGNIKESGVMNLEAFLYAINQINNDPNILPNVRVGTTVFDTCMSASRGVRELSGLLSGTTSDDEDVTLPGTFSTIVGIVGAETGDVTRDTAALTGQYKYAQVIITCLFSCLQNREVNNMLTWWAFAHLVNYFAHPVN